MKRAAFVTIGQSPRFDIVSEMRSRIGDGLTIQVFGVLDDLTPEEIATLRPGEGDEYLISRLRDGSEVVLRKVTIEKRLHEVLERLDQERFDFLVVLCTGDFEGVARNSLVVASQVVVDHGLAALASGARTVGILVPLPEQMNNVHFEPDPAQRLIVSHANPYTGERFEEAAEELSEAELIIMHCMGYTETQRRTVARVSGRPVLLARRMVADAVAQLL